ncbi:MAG: SusC/RagA family TonB-linked outer membrane protein [Flavobacteriaceae bacterium]
MRISVLLFLTFNLTVANSFSQNKVTLKVQNANVSQVLDEIEAKTDYMFIYQLDVYDFNKMISLNVKNEPIKKVLDIIFENKLEYEVIDNKVLLKAKEKIPTKENIILEEIEVQKRTINGNVSDSEGNPLPGAAIQEVGTQNGTTTDFDGNFSIEIENDNAELQFSFIGFKSQTVNVGSSDTINVTLLADASSLDEIVVTGYGTQLLRNITGSVSTIDSEVIENRSLTSAGAALSGTTAGVFVSQNSGEAGQDEISIRIRGVSTLNNSAPLVIIDGIEGDLNLLNPNDIESISILKDAASGAIYGSRASNGVVVVKTKRGSRNQAAQFQYSGTFGSSSAVKLPDVNYDPVYNMNFKNLARTNFGGEPIYTPAQIAEAGSQTTWWRDPMNDLIQTAPVNVHDLSVTGGSENINYRVALGILDQESIAAGGNYFDRHNVRINLDASPTDKFDIGTTISLSRSSQEGTQQALNSSNLQGPQALGVQLQNTLGPIYNADGEYAMISPTFAGFNVGPGTGRNNNYGYVNGDYYNIDQTINNVLLNAYIAYKPIENLTLKATGAVRNRSTFNNIFNKKVRNFFPDGTSYFAPDSDRNRSNESIEFFTETYFVTADYNVDIGEGNLKALVGYSQEENSIKNFRASRDGHLTDGIQVLDAGQPTNQLNSGSETGFAVQSLFARVNYNYKGKYLLEANVRQDGSSRFLNDKWGTFPSFSAGWILSEESFLNSSNTIDYLKVRGSWGKLGNSNIPNFAFAKALSLTEGYSFGGVIVPGVGQSSLGNENLSWEKTTTTNFGVNLVLKNGLGIDFDLFQRQTDDILFNLPVNVLTGFTSQFTNAASMETNGWELALNYNKNFGELNLQVGANISNAQNLVTDLNPNIAGGETDRIFLSNGAILGEGYRPGAFWGFESDGIFNDEAELNSAADHSLMGSEVGDVKFVDLDGDGAITLEDRTDIGVDVPEITYGFNIFAGYKNWDLAAIFQGIGSASFQGTFELFKPDAGGYNTANLWEDNWTPQNTDAMMPRVWAGQAASPSDLYPSDFFIWDRAYLRLKNLQVGYTFNLESIKIDSVRAFFNGTNLWTSTDFPLIDPEIRTGVGANDLYGSGQEAQAGRAPYMFPQLRVLSFGIQAKF